MLTHDAEFDRQVRYSIYSFFVRAGQAPTVADVALQLDAPFPAVEESFRRLGAAKTIALAPGSVYIWMAHPFSALPTAYPVKTAQGHYWANCAWDALGIPAMLGTDSETVTRCPASGAELTLGVTNGKVHASGGVIHFAVPPRQFWENIGFT